MRTGCETLEQQQESCPTSPPSTALQGLTSRTDALRKQSLCHISPLQKTAVRTGCETLEQQQEALAQQQESCPTSPPITAPQGLTLRTDALRKQSLCHISPLQKTAVRTGCETLEQQQEALAQQQESCPTSPPITALQGLTLRTDALRKQSLCHISPLQKTAVRTGCETLEQQQESCPTSPPITAPNVAF